MKKPFYHHLIIIDQIHIGLDALELSPEEKKELVELAENNIDHKVMDTVLSDLSNEDKKTFLSLVLRSDHDEIWKMLREKIENAEEKIGKAASDILKTLHADIHEVHKKHHTS